ncbi:1,4-alpha-glucan branching protein GlgB [Paenibacillus sp. y28]|uniref:1,4-alpha-glucan branching protein GlgB n=1 Tax=Paenibacillus sp. y28 TaxID=3129110 RepID=UPI003019BB80
MIQTVPSDHDLYLFHQGSLHHSYRLLGAHVIREAGQDAVRFAVWAPNARDVRVVGDFNGWCGEHHRMQKASAGGIWHLSIPGLPEGTVYKYEIHTLYGEVLLKADPYAFRSELRPRTASVVTSLDGYCWNDSAWLRARNRNTPYNRPLLIYETHLGSWKIKPDGQFYTYEELSIELVDYAVEMGYTHIELLPLSEHPLDLSWGYQITGYFSATSRYGTPHQLMSFIDQCHQKGIGVIMDWVPSHFCKDAHGLRRFDGYPLYEYADERKAEKPEWGTLSFDYGRPEVISFLISNALFWMDVYHIDGLRVDAVASMLYLNFGKPESMWTRNGNGGYENLDAIAFLRKLNETVFHYYPHALMMAEDSSDWPLVCGPTDKGGLGFNYKWNMGWMNDMLEYMELDPIYRKHHHQLLTFSYMYAWSENYVLPLSHDEVVHGKKSLLDKMPGDYWQKFASLRLLYGYMFAHPGKKLLFMGGEFGQFAEWKHFEGDQQDWHLLGYDMHRNMQGYVRELNHFYQSQKALWQRDHDPYGFEWIDPHDTSQSIVTFIRRGKKKKDELVIVCNFTPMVYGDYRIGVPKSGNYKEVFTSDDVRFGGSGVQNAGLLPSEKVPWHDRERSIRVRIPPLAVAIFQRTSERGTSR